jgi:hypothetical protein
MTPEQEKFWYCLKWNHRHYAKKTGDHLSSIANSKRPYWRRKFTKIADDYFNEVMDLAPNVIEILKVTKIWLSEYQLPVHEHIEFKTFDRYYETCGPTIIKLTIDGTLHKITST